MPEIETLARKLRSVLIGKRVAGVRLSGLPLRRPIDDQFPAKLRGRTIRQILRRGKYLVLKLEPQAFWIIHLGMSGKILYHAAAGECANHTHAVFHFSDSTRLEYRDFRRFGLLAAYEVRRINEIPEINSLGIDPLSPMFCRKWLFPLLQKSRQDVKSFLLDQHKIAGLGNIYACEVLFLARIKPTRRCYTLTPLETVRLVHAIRDVLRLAIRHRGTSFSDFMDSDGNPGENQNNLRVFQREGKNCVRCRAPIQRMKQGNRSSFFCSHCQR